MKKYLKIFSKVVRRMKLKLYMHAYDINLYKVCVFIVLVQLLWLLWQLEVSIVLYGEKWELSIPVVSLGIFEFYFYMNICSVALHDFM